MEGGGANNYMYTCTWIRLRFGESVLEHLVWSRSYCTSLTL